jgi:hypothetical protein
MIGSTVFAAEFVWEQTLLTWQNGPQMVGFFLTETGLILIALASLLLLAAWICTVAVLTIRDLLKRRSISWSRYLGLAAAVGLLILPVLPYSFWQRMFVERLVHSPHASAFLTDAAADGDMELTKGLLAQGVAIDARSDYGRTALHVAVIQGQIQLIEYLISNGADVNATDQYGKTPLDLALEDKRHDAAQILIAHGGREVWGLHQKDQHSITVTPSESR